MKVTWSWSLEEKDEITPRFKMNLIMIIVKEIMKYQKFIKDETKCTLLHI